MLDAEAVYQRWYYQPGFGTYPSSNLLAQNPGRVRAWKLEAEDAAVGTSYAQHVMAAYKFLVRFYSPGDCVYMFGFSRGAYVALLTAEMVDHIGLLGSGNEELIRFAWQIFAVWKRRCARRDTKWEKREEQYQTMKTFRETFCQPMARIRFLGLFDTVNSIPRSEGRRSKLEFPFTTRVTAKVIRHAISIDERRTRFRNELLSDSRPRAHSRRADFHSWLVRHGLHINHSRKGCRFSLKSGGKRPVHDIPAEKCGGLDTLYKSSSRGTEAADDDADETEQDIREVWFSGSHPDVGGGMVLAENETWPLSHIPLVWIVHEAHRAGLNFDMDKLVQFNCVDATTLQSDSPGECATEKRGSEDSSEKETGFEQALRSAGKHGQLHDSLRYRQGVPWPEVLSWRFLEFLPFRRMDLRKDQTWKPIRWPLPRGEERNIPQEAEIHSSVIMRMKTDPQYRPGNLIDNEIEAGKEILPQLEIFRDQGCPVRETYRRKRD